MFSPKQKITASQVTTFSINLKATKYSKVCMVQKINIFTKVFIFVYFGSKPEENKPQKLGQRCNSVLISLIGSLIGLISVISSLISGLIGLICLIHGLFSLIGSLICLINGLISIIGSLISLITGLISLIGGLISLISGLIGLFGGVIGGLISLI